MIILASVIIGTVIFLLLGYFLFSDSEYEDFYNKTWEDKNDNIFK